MVDVQAGRRRGGIDGWREDAGVGGGAGARPGGVALLGDAHRLLGYVWDLGDPDDPVIQVFAHNCDGELLSPYSAAAAKGTPDALLDAANRAEFLLRDDRHIQAEAAHTLASSLAQGVAAHAHIEFTPRPFAEQGASSAPSAGAQQPAATLQSSEDYDLTPISAAPPQRAQTYDKTQASKVPVPSPQPYAPPQAPPAAQGARKGLPAWAIALVVALGVGVLGGGVYWYLSHNPGAAAGTSSATAYDQRFVGTWACSRETRANDETGEEMTNDHPPLGYGYVILNDDGTARVTEGYDSWSLEWQSDGDVVTLMMGSTEAFTFTLQDEMLTMQVADIGYSAGYARIDPTEYVSWEDARVYCYNQAYNSVPLDRTVADTDQCLIQVVAKGYDYWDASPCYEIKVTNRTDEPMGVIVLSDQQMDGELEYDETLDWNWSYSAEVSEDEFYTDIATGYTVAPDSSVIFTRSHSELTPDWAAGSLGELANLHLNIGAWRAIETGGGSYVADTVQFYTFAE